MFKTFQQIEEISEEAYADSQFAGVEQLFNSSQDILCAASTIDFENVNDIYFFIEANGTFIKSEDDFVMYELDDIKFVLADFNEELCVIVRKNDVEEIKIMFDID